MEYKINIKTDHPIAYDSPDHTHPWGTKRDNKIEFSYVDEICKYYDRQINFLDLGCAGGRLAVEMAERGHISVGLEGSDFSIKHERPYWPDYHKKNLFTCDITKPFEVQHDNEIVQFDMINAWEVLEHIHKDDLPMLFDNIYKHLKPGGIFVCSVCWASDTPTGVQLHLTRKTAPWWITMFQEHNFIPIGNKIDVNKQKCNYLFKHRNRGKIGRCQFWMTWTK